MPKVYAQTAAGEFFL